jgi:hypothetical protein
MKTPIVEVRQKNLFVLAEFDGIFIDAFMQTRHNMMNNKTCHVIDSNADLWSFAFVHTNHVGIRKFVSALAWNVSCDRYTYAKETSISVGRFREIVEPHRRDASPDSSEMAMALLASIATCDSADPLRSHIHLLNL